MLRGTIAVVIAGALMAAGCAGVDAPQHGATSARPAAEAAKFEQDRKAIDKISVLTDANGDGVMDKRVIFYEGLDLVTGLVFHQDGVIVTQAPDILWLRDTNGDGKADKREIVFGPLGFRPGARVQLTDFADRTAIVRGMNVGKKEAPYLDFHAAADFARMRDDWGMNAVRFYFPWAAVEPSPGQYDDAFLDQVRQRLDWAAAAKVDVRATATIVEVWRDGVRVTSHERSYGPKGTVITDPSHRPKSHQAYGDWPPSRVIGWAENIGPHVAEVVRKILASRPHPEKGYRSCLALFRDVRRYDPARVPARARDRRTDKAQRRGDPAPQPRSHRRRAATQQTLRPTRADSRGRLLRQEGDGDR